MSMLVEPGIRLAGRYRLEERLSQLDGSTLWKAVDEPLARPVALRTFADDFEGADRVIAAARAASRITDSRFAQVFDADVSPQQTYIVREWIEGNRLLDLLEDGPLELDRAVRFIGQAADALTAAHAGGLAHLRLDPSRLMWAKGGTVKITGLAIDSALHGLALDESAPLRDTRALGSLLYAALTGCWPGSGDAGLPPAPRRDGRVLPPGEVRPHVPKSVSDITCRTLGERPDLGSDDPQSPEESFESPAEVRRALAQVPRLGPVPPPQTPRRPAAPAGAETPPPQAPAAPDRPAGRHPVRTALIAAGAVVVVIATALGAWFAGRTIGGGSGDVAGQGDASPSPSASSASMHALPVRQIEDYDPYDPKHRAHPDEVQYAIDSQADTAWTTQTYNGAALGGLKPGVGLMLDMGSSATIHDVQADLVGSGTSLVLYAGDKPKLQAMHKAATAEHASQHASLRPSKPVHARYLLLWITKLPEVSDGYQAAISEIVVNGKS